MSPASVLTKFPTLDSGVRAVELEACVQRLLTKKPPPCHRSIPEVPMLTGLPSPGGAQTGPISPLRAKALVRKTICFRLFAFGIKACKSTGGFHVPGGTSRRHFQALDELFVHVLKQRSGEGFGEVPAASNRPSARLQSRLRQLS